MALNNSTTHIPDKFRGVTLSIWQKILLWLGRPIFVTLKPGEVCIIFIEDGRLKSKCEYSSAVEARKVWKARAKKRRSPSLAPVSLKSDISSAGPAVNIPDDDKGDGDEGSGAGRPSGGGHVQP
ncbi:hypothetical protein [Winslowiella toletana]|uniref:hypothetical protein n=1 Tax=Winslowiella toletana TaxID=92490 RepID=UPI00036AEB99|nr:hypothetical protein [Winslowiella toletana]